MRNLRVCKLRASLFVAASILGVATSAVGGTSGAFAILPAPAASAVATLQSNVTYSTPATNNAPANETQVGFVVGDLCASPFASPSCTNLLLQQASGNSINKLTVTISCSSSTADTQPGRPRSRTYR